MGFKVAIDTGGTFTDCILLDEEGQYSITKAPTTPDEPSQGIMEALTVVAQRERGMTLEELLAKCDVIVVGTTVATNIVLQNKGAKCCMITTKNFRDIIETHSNVIQEDLYNLELPRPRILIPRYLRFPVEERILVTGEVLTPLKEKEAREAARRAKAYNCEVVVVCFFHSYANNQHEKRMAQIVKEEYPEAEVVLSSDILPRPNEFNRFSTTVLAGYIGPASVKFLTGLEKHLRDANFEGALLITTSNAGVTTVEHSIEKPIQMLSSGPAAGVLSASFLGKLVNLQNIIISDMGGTSFDVSIIPKGRILTTNESMVVDQRNAAPSVDVRGIGAGGGSIAWLDQRGILCVGPESAGADPGPVCYGKGGKRPTVTDADVLLGHIPADYFLGGELSLDVSLAEEAIKKEIAEPLGLDVIEAAYAIYSIANAAMVEQTFLTCVSLGYDPREFVFCAAGGAGPTHAFDIAAGLGVKELYIPKTASVFCAFGMIAGADFKYEFSHFLPRSEVRMDLSEVNEIYQSMEKEGIGLLKRIKGLDDKAMKVRRGADMRYMGQVWDTEATLPETRPGETVTQDDMTALLEDFHERHEEIFGFSDRTMAAAITSLNLVARGERPRLEMVEQPVSPEDAFEALKRSRSVYFKELGGLVKTFCYDGDKLRHGNIVTGPAVIEEKTTTIVVPPKASIIVDRYGNYVGKLL